MRRFAAVDALGRIFDEVAEADLLPRNSLRRGIHHAFLPLGRDLGRVEDVAVLARAVTSGGKAPVVGGAGLGAVRGNGRLAAGRGDPVASVHGDALDGAYLAGLGVGQRRASSDPNTLLVGPLWKCLLIGVLNLEDVTQRTVLLPVVAVDCDLATGTLAAGAEPGSEHAAGPMVRRR